MAINVTVANNIPVNKVVEAGTLMQFTFTFPIGIVGLLPPGKNISDFSVVFSIYENIVIHGTRHITKPLQVGLNNNTGTATLTFPESSAGATFVIDYLLKGPIQTSLNIKSITITVGLPIGVGRGIEKVCWGVAEYASFGIPLLHKRDIGKNEWAFLHIYTKGMFGQSVWVKIFGDYNTNTLLLKEIKCVIQDNVVSIPYSMKSAISKWKSKYLLQPLLADFLHLSAGANKSKRNINYPGQSPILELHWNDIAPDPAKPTKAPPVKVMIAEYEEEEIRTNALCSLEFRPDDTYIGNYGFDWVRNGDTSTLEQQLRQQLRQFHREIELILNKLLPLLPPRPPLLLQRLRRLLGQLQLPLPLPQLQPQLQLLQRDIELQRLRQQLRQHLPHRLLAAKLPFNDFAFNDCMGKHYADSNTAVHNFGINIIQTNGNESGPLFKKDNTHHNPHNFYISPIALEDITAPDINRMTEVDNSFGDGRMYERLKRRYKKLIFNWQMQPAGPFYETYTPIMTLMNGKTANLKLLFNNNNNNNPAIIKFELSESAKKYLNLNRTEFTPVLNQQLYDLSIECRGEFNHEYTLYARAHAVANGPGQICGMLRILPNSKKYQHKVKIAVFKVQTDIRPRRYVNIHIKRGKFDLNEKDRITDILGQALVIPEFVIKDLDTNVANPFHRRDTMDSADYFGANLIKRDALTGEIRIDDSKDIDIKKYLLSRINPKYNDYYKIFVFHEKKDNYTNGYTWGDKYTLLFKNRTTEAGAHELLHALKLNHTFDGHSENTKFTYRYRTTDNIMDYGHQFPELVVKSLFHWQWQIINIKIK